MKGKLWSVWTAAVLMLALAAMAFCALPSRADFYALEPLPAPEWSDSVSGTEDPVDINTAGLEELMKLPQIGRVRAQAILDYRAEHGPFRYPEELIYVPGIGEGTLDGLLDLITTGGK